MMNIRNYVRAQSLEEAYDLLQKNKRNRVIGGMLWLKMTNVNVPTAIDLCDLGLDTIEETDEITSHRPRKPVSRVTSLNALGKARVSDSCFSAGKICRSCFMAQSSVLVFLR